MAKLWGGFVAAVAIVLFLPVAAIAQTGTIAGSVKDPTGGVLPGVTVEALSPALLERTRTAVTDAGGNFKLVDLRLGTYTVTFTLPGFATLKREGIELSAGVTATVNAEMRVGAVEETVMVSAQSPLVDVQNANQHVAMTRELLDDLPTGRQFGHYGVLIPGVVTNVQDVGGASTNVSTTNIIGVHGSNANEMPMIIDGMRYGNIFGTGGGASGPYLVNNGMVEEMAIDTSGAGADAEVGGFRANVVLKSGGNRFSSSWYGGGFTQGLEANNITPDLRSRGALTPSLVTKLYDFNVGIGGPIKQDRVWFYASFRDYGSDQQPTGAYSASDPTAVVFKPPTVVNGAITSYNSASQTLPINQITNMNFNGRVVVQTSPTSKLSLYADQMPRCVCENGLSATTTLQATTYYHNPVNGIEQVTWNWTISNRLLLELGETFKPDSWAFDAQSGLASNLSPVLDLATGVTSRAPGPLGWQDQKSFQHNGKAVLTYVTGSSNLKVGGQWFSGSRTAHQYTNNNSELVLRNGVPQSIIEYTTPLVAQEDLKMNLGLFAQEQYTKKRLTANLGLRFDYLNEYIPPQQLAATQFAPALSYPEIDNVPNWKDISPRFGLAYDVFGNGKTALKWNLGRFVEAQAAGFPQAVNPTRAFGTVSGVRAWTSPDPNVIGCDLTNPAANGSCGAVLNPNFGKAATAAYAYDPATVNGWQQRGYNWELMTGIQQQVTNGFSVEASYNRRWFGNFRVAAATQVTTADYDSYCVATPLDPRLPGGGGQQICGFYNIKPQFAGLDQTNIQITSANNFGTISQHYDGVDLAAKLRLPRGVILQGGMSAGRTDTNWCGITQPNVIGISPYIGVTGSPLATWAQFSRQAPYCASTPPFLTQVKLAAVYPLRWEELVTSATFQSIVYPQEFYGAFGGILAGNAFTNAQIAPSLGRNLAGGAQSAVLQMIAPGSEYGDRLYQLDLRVSRNFKVGHSKIQPQVDIFNLFNNNAVLTLNNTYGRLWQQPLSILQGRVLKFGIEANF